jgi:predicted unusual protein kinase regulating ubiquinone biosynthesis (AarF/ABC1/UbiB family)
MPERDPEGSSVLGRFRRAARVGAAVGGQAVRLAGGRVLGLDRGAHAAELRTALGGLKGPLMKVAQIMSTVPDLLPEEYAREFIQLQANAPAMGPAFVRRRMESEMGPRWRDRFAGFPEQAAAAASLGQVHKALAHDGTALACKLQYPNMRDVVESDLAQLRIALAIYHRYDRTIDTSKIVEELSDRLREELDYEREARHARLFRLMLDGERDVYVPEVWEELSTRRLLTMTWVDGAPMLSVKTAPLDARNAVAHAMFRAWYVPFYD